MNLPKIHSISKKILVGALGAFLSFFLLFHASANLLILRHDGGEWYNAFCHFMGTYIIVKVMEIVLIAALLQLYSMHRIGSELEKEAKK